MQSLVFAATAVVHFARARHCWLALLAVLSLVSVRSVQAQAVPHVSVIASGLNSPRGLTFGPDGFLYVAEGGLGGMLSTVGTCPQVPFPIGPYTGGFTARISRISKDGQVTTVVSGLPSSKTNDASGGFISGVADVAFVGNTLYALLGGGGCSHGLDGTTNSILRVNANGTTTLIADLSAFQKANPVVHPQPDDFEPDGTWYSMVAVRGNLYAVEPNHGELDEIAPNGHIRRIADISATQGHIVPTALAYHGNFFVGNLGTFPMAQGGEGVLQITPHGHVRAAVTGLTAVLGVAFDDEERMYVLETFTGQPFPGPPAIGTGRVLRVSEDGRLQTIVTGLNFPTGMTFGPDGFLYVSNNGFGAPPGAGQIVRITVPK